MSKKHHDYLVIGTGSAGQLFAVAAAEAGHNVAIADYQAYGGTCPLRGCDPKKVLLVAVHAMNTVQRMDGRGFNGEPPFSWADLQAWKREFTEAIPPGTHDKMREHGIACYHGKARFTAPHELTIGSDEIKADKVVIATGGTPAPLDFPGAELLLTSDEFLDMDELPESMIIVGGGYIGAEFAHVATVLGSRVTVIASADSPVDNFDDDLNTLLAEAARARGMKFHFNSKATKVEKTDDGRLRVTVESENGGETTVTADRVFHCAGRVPNIEALDLERAGIEAGKKGIAVDPRCCTSVRAHYAVGDCSDSGFDLTPVANYEARLLADNLFENANRQIDYLPIPTLSFTIPPIASVGMTAKEAADSKRNLRTNYAVTTENFHAKHQRAMVAAHKVIIDADRHVVVGAHLLGPGAEDLVNLFTMAIKEEIPIQSLRRMVWAYPTAGALISGMVGA